MPNVHAPAGNGESGQGSRSGLTPRPHEPRWPAAAIRFISGRA
ncbi:hypothetical protein SXCC_00388 [Gluconacetobacter sp. SXCC-1]|nr:hypothetical protein SXCC_00388 [Gluconacetobacter sp. SXCC-1]